MPSPNPKSSAPVQKPPALGGKSSKKTKGKKTKGKK
jgi:hypothetical protein